MLIGVDPPRRDLRMTCRFEMTLFKTGRAWQPHAWKVRSGDRLSSVVAPNAGNTANETVGYSYDDHPDPTVPNSTEYVVSATQSFPGSVTQQIVSDLSGKPRSITAKTSGGSVLRSVDYA